MCRIIKNIKILPKENVEHNELMTLLCVIFSNYNLHNNNFLVDVMSLLFITEEGRKE